MDRLDDWHHRSGENIDFFCVGYTDCASSEDAEEIGSLTDDSDRRSFYYSASAFNDIRKHVSAQSDWDYSGEADLILVNAIQSESSGWGSDDPMSSLALEEIVALDIQKIVDERVYDSPARLMESICRAADGAQACNLNDFADREFLGTLFREGLQRLVRASGLGGLLGARHFIVGRQLFDDIG